MKKPSILIGTIILVLGAAGNAAALQFTDEVFRGFSQPFIFSEDNPSVGYIHDITDDGFYPDMTLTSASLDIRFWGVEEVDSSFEIYLDDSSARNIDGIKHWAILFWLNDFSLDLGADISYLQADGILDVTLTRTSGGSAEILGFNSTLTAYTDEPAPVPTPEPASIILFGIGLVGFALYQKRSKTG